MGSDPPAPLVDTKGLACLGILIIVVVALFMGVNGTLTATGMTLLAGLAGYEVGTRRAQT